MAKLIRKPVKIKAAGSRPKEILEFVGRVNTGTGAVSVACMRSPAGWAEPGQTPRFDEYTVVLKGVLKVETRSGVLWVKSGQGVIASRGQWVRYSTPRRGGAEYVAVCLPAFSLKTVHRDADLPSKRQGRGSR